MPQDIDVGQNVEVDDLLDALLMEKESNPDAKTRPANSITVFDVDKACATARNASNTMLEVRLFLAAVFSFSSFTSSSNYVIRECLGSVLDLKTVATIDWCKQLMDHLKAGFQNFVESYTIWSPVTFLVFCLDNLDCHETGNAAMKTPRLQYYTSSMVDDVFTRLGEDIKVKPWAHTVYGKNGIPDVQLDKIDYSFIPDLKKKHKHKAPNAKRYKIGKLGKKEKCPFEEQNDSFVRVPNMRNMLASHLDDLDLPTDMAIKVDHIIEKYQLSWRNAVEDITSKEMRHCAQELEELFGLEARNTINKDESSKRVVVDLGTFKFTEDAFVDVFQPHGWMSNWVVQALVNVWNEQWKGQNVMLSIAATAIIAEYRKLLASEIWFHKDNLAMVDLTKTDSEKSDEERDTGTRTYIETDGRANGEESAGDSDRKGDASIKEESDATASDRDARKRKHSETESEIDGRANARAPRTASASRDSIPKKTRIVESINKNVEVHLAYPLEGIGSTVILLIDQSVN
ncbi:hypothetical protein [Oryza sativa Japonica Group]|uniref:Uncharacterized protein P0710A02.20 n=1 Tax=Oryza sativa subsp. japonica TaxID=39947 RepID=Q94JC2_ORYSJ|nr:hypothetical protein [Oryza sativa Japonica Group]